MNLCRYECASLQYFSQFVSSMFTRSNLIFVLFLEEPIQLSKGQHVSCLHIHFCSGPAAVRMHKQRLFGVLEKLSSEKITVE